MAFEASEVSAFRYLGARFDPASAVAEFDYELTGGAETQRFTERIEFDPGDAPALAGEERARFDAVLVLLGAMLGLSYYKAAAPDRIELAVPGLTPEAVRYLQLAIRSGLAEFAYRNALPGPLEPRIEATMPLATWSGGIRSATGRPLVPIGGGKDSIVTVESLTRAGIDPVQFAVNPNAIIRAVAAVPGHPFVAARRTLDPRLLALNAEGALNGHVPVTLMNTLIAVAQSLLLGLGPVVMSNESSASDPTLTWNGFPVNHQWSKSLEAEKALVEVLRAQAGLEGATFSLLRPFSELRIARGFARTSGYDHATVSCNRAFRIDAATPGWCGDCDKCRFVFLALAPFMEPDRLVGIIGRDLLADPAQLPGYRALLGLGAHKPFECVGEEAESSVAMSLVSRIPHWADSAVVRALREEVPQLSAGDPELEARILGESEALVVPADYERARHALV